MISPICGIFKKQTDRRREQIGGGQRQVVGVGEMGAAIKRTNVQLEGKYALGL